MFYWPTELLYFHIGYDSITLYHKTLIFNLFLQHMKKWKFCWDGYSNPPEQATTCITTVIVCFLVMQYVWKCFLMALYSFIHRLLLHILDFILSNSFLLKFIPYKTMNLRELPQTKTCYNCVYRFLEIWWITSTRI